MTKIEIPSTKTMIQVHCSATKPSMDIGAETINQWHLDRGWSGIGYHYVVRKDGTVELGRPIAKDPAGIKGHNSNAVAVCYVGGLAEDGSSEFDALPEVQYEALVALIKHIHAQIPNAEIVGHSELAAKDCPCLDMDKLRAADNSTYMISSEGRQLLLDIQTELDDTDTISEEFIDGILVEHTPVRYVNGMYTITLDTGHLITGTSLDNLRAHLILTINVLAGLFSYDN